MAVSTPTGRPPRGTLSVVVNPSGPSLDDLVDKEVAAIAAASRASSDRASSEAKNKNRAWRVIIQLVGEHLPPDFGMEVSDDRGVVRLVPASTLGGFRRRISSAVLSRQFCQDRLEVLLGNYTPHSAKGRDDSDYYFPANQPAIFLGYYSAQYSEAEVERSVREKWNGVLSPLAQRLAVSRQSRAAFTAAAWTTLLVAAGFACVGSCRACLP